LEVLTETTKRNKSSFAESRGWGSPYEGISNPFLTERASVFQQNESYEIFYIKKRVRWGFAFSIGNKEHLAEDY